MNNEENLDATFMRLFKIVDALRLSGEKRFGRTKLDLLVSLTFRQERSLRIVGDGEKSTPEGIRLKDLATALRTTIPATSVLVEIMVKKNLFIRKPSSTDRRSLCLRLTPFGWETLELIRKNLREVANDLTCDLSLQDQRNFSRIVDHFYEKIVEKND